MPKTLSVGRDSEGQCLAVGGQAAFSPPPSSAPRENLGGPHQAEMLGKGSVSLGPLWFVHLAGRGALTSGSAQTTVST